MALYPTTFMTRLYSWLISSPLTRVLLLLPVIGFFIYFFALRYNIPWFDDYENIPYFLNQFLSTPSFTEKLDALMRPNNEHRVLYARLVTLGQYFLTGGLNFANLMLWGNAGLVLMFYLLYRALLRQEGDMKKAVVGVLPVPLLLFSAQMYLMTFTAVFSLQYLSIITLVMLTLFVLTTDRPVNFGLAVALAVLSSFSMGNGLLVWPAGAAILIIQRRWGALGAWVLLGGVCGYLYFLGYPVQQGNGEGFAYVVKHPLQTLAGFIIFAGSAFDLFSTLPLKHRLYLPFLAGMFLLAGLGYWAIRTLFQTKRNTSFLETFVFGCVLFLVATMGLIALFRIRFYFGMVLHIPYRIYSLTLWSLASVLLFSRLSEMARGRFWPIVWALFLGLNMVTYATYLPEAIARRKHMQGLTFNQKYSAIGLGGTRNSKLAAYISNQLTMMQKRGWYHLPEPVITTDEQQILTPVGTLASIAPLQISRTPDYIVVADNEPDYYVGYNTATYVVMKSDQHTYLMLGEKKPPITFWPWRIEPGFSTAIPVQMVQPGHYQLGLFRTYPNRTERQFTNQFIDVK